MTNMLENAQVSRRTFMKGSALAGLGAAAMGTGAVSLFGCSPSADGAKGGDAAATQAVEETTTWGHCAINCPGRCSLKFHVQDDEVAWVETYTSKDAGFDEVQPRACLRGRTYRRWLANPDRINYPMKRVGKRGEGKFEQISWDEAVDTIASELKRIIDEYGNESVYIPYATGVSSTTARSLPRFMNCIGGCLGSYGDYSAMQMEMIVPHTYGASGFSGSTLNAAEDAALILAFGTSPTETRQGGAVSHYDWVHLRETTKGKMIYIDPRMNDSVMGRSAEWQPINPGTDAALCSAIAHELIANDLVDKEFLDTYCVGYDEDTMPESAKGQSKSYKDYIMGTGYDMVEKTPEWAAPICGISADRIKELAAEIGAAKPLYVVQGWGPQRRSNGELNCWSIMMLPLLTGQVGLPGTSNGCREGSYSISLQSLPAGDNPIKAKIPVFLFTEAIDHGTEMTALNSAVTGADKLNQNIKCMLNYAGNCLTNQHGDINYAHDILADESKCEFIVVWETAMTDSAKYADILLPDLFRFEQVSQIGTGGDNAYMISGQPCTTPKFERKTLYDALTLIADKMGVKEQFTEGKTQEEWIKELYEKTREKDTELPTYDEAMEMGVYTRKNPKGATIAFEAFRNDPAANPLDTPTGKIEIYSETLAGIASTWELGEEDLISPIPVYTHGFTETDVPTDEFPLRCSGFHYRGRTHSSWGGIELLKEVNPQEAWINPADAKERSIKQGDKIRVKNAFGEIEILAKVTPRVVPGTVCISQGAWHDADMYGDRVDKGGCINTLTTHRPSPLAKGNPQHSNICQVTKA
ncbi:DMSO/selenate family reductase complex A subunit [Eggerthella lenta]|uniref:DMSO/selenate family reductase complex A subunit n=1 Tax=Eggerthella lenta TaxID=84112 RepID=UPI000DF75033|nr:DMSO/selenate family reductase complex A subunit [Eggerthella lenta]RDC13372.1 dimethyl sulfoxide reductase subunit A [Eggerthella lenta]